jgi:hypothetical protein
MPRKAELSRVAIAVALMFVSVGAFAQRSRPSVTPAMTPSLFDTTSLVPGTLTPCMFLVSLTDAQKAQIQSILLVAQPTLQSLAAQIQTDHSGLADAVAAGATNACNVGTAYLKLQTDQDAMDAELRILQPQLESVLTSDQKARIAGCLATLANIGRGKP